ncbi:MAG: hypothetical protein DWH91_16275 [Planctomycetota bacterium]|nr:MAG: hypothetical protein DWH91_16275 [Planctomycetota bacterium]
MAAESLTVQIQGDTQGLTTALDEAFSRVQQLQSAAESAGASAESLGPRLAGAASALQPLQQLAQTLSRISQQATALGQQPVTLNVQPALGAVQTLMSAIQSVAAQLQTLAWPGVGPQPSGSPGAPSPGIPHPGSSPGPVGPLLTPQLALSQPALVSVPRPSPLALETGASATAIRSATVPPFSLPVVLPLGSLRGKSPEEAPPLVGRSSMNPGTTELSPGALPDSPRNSSSAVVNHFGGITIAVRETADVNSLMRDLRLQGLSIRHRQG